MQFSSDKLDDIDNMDATKKVKRQRAENFSAEEKTVVIELLAKYKSLIENKKSGKCRREKYLAR